MGDITPEELEMLQKIRADRALLVEQKTNVSKAAAAAAKARWLMNGGYNRAHADIADADIRSYVEKVFCLLSVDEDCILEEAKKLDSMG